MTQAPRIAATLLIVAAALGGHPAPADAEIRCQGRFQVIQGSLHSTPWCEDNYLAEVAREYGMRVDPKAVRNNPGVKGQVCRFAGRDGRVRDICAGYLNEGRRGWPG